MSFNPLNDYKDAGGHEKMERREPCRKCKNGITIKPPVLFHCWACWAGWPANTTPVMDLTRHPHYLKTLERIQAKAAAKAELLLALAEELVA